MYSGQQFRRLKRLWKIVVGAIFQSVNAIFCCSSCRQHKDWRVQGTPNALQYLEAIDSREHHIEDDQKKVLLTSHTDAVFAAKGGCNRESCRPAVFCD
jgi:hypothetical protein